MKGGRKLRLPDELAMRIGHENEVNEVKISVAKELQDAVLGKVPKKKKGE